MNTHEIFLQVVLSLRYNQQVIYDTKFHFCYEDLANKDSLRHHQKYYEYVQYILELDFQSFGSLVVSIHVNPDDLVHYDQMQLICSTRDHVIYQFLHNEI